MANNDKTNGIIQLFQRPFSNLSRRARIILWLRLVTLVLAIVFSTILLTADTFTLPVSIVHCEGAQVAAGLYDTLKKTSTAQNSFITTSEIKLLASYIERQIEGTPEVLMEGLNSWCSLDYTYAGIDYEQLDQNDGDHVFRMDQIHSHKNLTVSCHSSGKIQTFDYRSQLSEIGLNIILAYAYNADFSSDDTKSQITHSSSPYAASKSYKRSLQHRENLAKKHQILIPISIGFEASILLGLFVYYAKRKPSERDDSGIAFWIKNVFAVAATVNMLLSIASVNYLFWLLSALAHSVNDELSSYGVSLEYGTGYIVVLIFWLCSTVGVFVEWSGPVWCNPRIKRAKTNARESVISNKGPQSSRASRHSLLSDTVDDEYGDEDDPFFDSDEYEMDSITGQINPFESESEVDATAKSLKKEKSTILRTNSVADTESSFNLRSDTSLRDLNKQATNEENHGINLQGPSNSTKLNTFRSKSEQLLAQRKPPSSSLTVSTQPSYKRSTVSDSGLVPMSPIIMSHQSNVLPPKGKRDASKGTI